MGESEVKEAEVTSKEEFQDNGAAISVGGEEEGRR